jgi:hypothetical protein
MSREIETLIASAAFAAIFLLGGKLRVTRKGWRRASVSAAAGASVAYVFIHLLPDLGEASGKFVEATTSRAFSLAESHVYLAALFSFVVFYGLEHLVSWSRKGQPVEASERAAEKPVFTIHVCGFGLYAMMVSYMMIRSSGMGAMAVALYAVAMGLHFLSVSHALLEEHGLRYLKPGRYILAFCALAGWGCGLLFEIPQAQGATIMGLVAGGVIMNSVIMELPKEKEGKFWPFVAGAAAYAAIMLMATGVRTGA